MFWPMLAVAVGFLSIAVLGVLAVRVALEARRLGDQVAATTQRVERAAQDLERSAAGLARSGESLR